jgi:hypothetical protein
MEVHKPKLVANWRELMKEWGIIVLGVLTALLAEQAEQSIDWHHMVNAAIGDMDNELSSGDGPQAYARVAMHDCIARQLGSIREVVERGDRAGSRKLIDSFWLPKRTWDSLAREAANASDIASHMPHERMLQYRIAYEVIPDMQRLGDKELADLGRLRALPVSGGDLGASEKFAELDSVEALKLDNDAMARESQFILIRMKMTGLGLDRYFVDRNIHDARNHYAACMTGGPLSLGHTDKVHTFVS